MVQNLTSARFFGCLSSKKYQEGFAIAAANRPVIIAANNVLLLRFTNPTEKHYFLQ